MRESGEDNLLSNIYVIAARPLCRGEACLERERMLDTGESIVFAPSLKPNVKDKYGTRGRVLPRLVY